MATSPVLVPIQSRPLGHDTETLRFQRLERVRAQRRARLRYRLFLVASLVTARASAGVLGFATTRRTSFQRPGPSSSPAPVEMLRPASASAAATGSAFGPPPIAVVPAPPRADAVRRDATRPPRIQVQADQRVRPLSDSQDRGAVEPARDEPHDDAAVDPQAAIEWLLNTSRPRR
jgi:hypothetical protein